MNSKTFIIRNINKNVILARSAVKAQKTFERMKGLLGRGSLEEGEALLISHCRSIHMVFMKFAIDAIFVDKNQRIVGLVRGIRPNQFSPFFGRANYVIELPVGMIDISMSELGDELGLIGTDLIN